MGGEPKMKEYVLWSPYREFYVIWNRPPGRWREDRARLYRATVRAHSIEQAYRLAADGIEAKDGGPGIVQIEEPRRDQLEETR